MSLTRVRYFRVRRTGFVFLVLAASGLAVAAVASRPVPSFDDYTNVVVFSTAPVLQAIIAVGGIGSGLSSWERLARRPLLLWRFLSAVFLPVLAVAALVPAALALGTHNALPTAAQGVLVCFGLGLAVAPFAAYSVQAMTAMTYGMLSLLMASPDPGLEWLLVVDIEPSEAGMATAVAVWGSGSLLYAVLGERHRSTERA